MSNAPKTPRAAGRAATALNAPLAALPRSGRAAVFWAIYALAILSGASLLWRAPAPLIALSLPQPAGVPVLVPARDLPAFQRLRSGDLITATALAADLTADTLTDTVAVSGSLTLAPLRGGERITRAALLPVADPTLLDGAVVLAITAGPSLTFGGKLRPGTLVSAWAGDDQLAQRLLILAVNPLDPLGGADPLPPDPLGATDSAREWVIVVAAPAPLRRRLEAAADAQTLTFTIAP